MESFIFITLASNSLSRTSFGLNPCTNPRLFIGFISYPFYLMHENFIVAFSEVLIRYTESNVLLPSFIPFIPMTILVLISWVVAEKLEPKLRKSIDIFTKVNI